MTSNERIILKCLWDAKEKAHICFISRAAGLSSDYARFLARSLARAGYIEFADANICYLLTKGRNRFSAPEERDLDSGGQDSGPIVETVEPDAIVNPEIIVETVSASISEKDEPSSEDKSPDVDLDNGEEEITDSDEKSEDENKQDEDLGQVLAELDQFVKEETKPADEEDAEEDIIIEETKPEENLQDVKEIKEKIKEETEQIKQSIENAESGEDWFSKLRKAI